MFTILFRGNIRKDKMNLIDRILDIIFPPTCGICEKIGEGYICSKCYKEIEKYLYKNQREDIFYLLKYEGLIREKMIQYKFNDKPYLSKMFCEIFIKHENACEIPKKYDIIVPVPMHKKKKRLRGYNQSELIARGLGNYFKIQVEEKVLIKQRNTPMQSSLGKQERIKNVQNVYKVQYMEKIKGKNVLLIDDIYTTGATIKECKKVLQLADVKKIGVVIVAKD